MSAKYTFTKENLINIGKGALISAGGAAAIYLLQYLGTVQYSDANVAALVSWFVPFAINVVKEWLRNK